MRGKPTVAKTRYERLTYTAKGRPLPNRRPSKNRQRDPAHVRISQLAAAIAEDKAFYSANGYVHIRNVFNSSEAALLSRWVEEIRAWPQSNESKWMHHYEHTAHGARLTRTENIVSYHPQLGRWLMAGKLPSLVGALLGEDVFLYKEKINYKYPGGAGYAAHQDAPAYKQIAVKCLPWWLSSVRL
jgi:hypothetical protein